MKPLLCTVVALCLIVAATAHPDNIEEVKQLPQANEPIIEPEESESQTRTERCTTCTSNLKFKSFTPAGVLEQLRADLQGPLGGEVHTQSSFKGCSSDKGCAGIKVKDGQVVEKYGNINAFNAAAASDTDKEFTFHAANSLPFWWMGENSPFKSNGGNFENFSKSSSSSFSSESSGAGGGSFGGSLDLAGNPFFNGAFAGGAAGAGGLAAGLSGSATNNKPSTYQSSYESSYSSSNKGDVDLSGNPFLNGGLNKFGQEGFQAQGSFGQGSQYGSGAGFASQSGGASGFGPSQGKFSSGSKYSGSGYTPSSPRPFSASNGGSSVNLIQSQEVGEFDFDQQQQTQTNIDEAFQETGNVFGHENTGGELQQTCAGQGYVCVHKAQCNNGIVSTNGAGLLQARTKKQYCNTNTEICCRIETSSLTGVDYQGSLGVDSGTYSGSAGQGSGLFVSSSQGSDSSSTGSSGSKFEGSFGNTNKGSSNSGSSGSRFEGSFGNTNKGSSNSGISGTRFEGSFGNTNKGSSNSGSSGSRFEGSFGNTNKGSSNSGSSGSRFEGSFGDTNKGSSNSGSSGSRFEGSFGTTSQGSFGQGSSQGSNQGFGAEGSYESGSGSASGSFGSGNRGVTQGSSSSSFESSSSSSSFESGNKYGSASGFNPTQAPGRFGSTEGNFNNEVYKKTSQTNFIESDSFSSGSEVAGVYRPGAVGSGLKPGIPYLPPDNTDSGSNVITSTYRPPTFVTSPRTTTPKPYRPSTTPAGYLPPPQGESSINRETYVPPDTEGEIILDTNRFPPPKPFVPITVPSGCAAALKCTPIEFCTAEGVISNTTVFLNPDQEAYRVPLTDCKDTTGRVGKCCRDPFYTDPWPVDQLGKWVPRVFGGNDGQYTPDNRGSSNNPRPSVTVRPPSTGSIILNNFRTTTKSPFGPNLVTQGAYQKGQYEVRGEGQFGQGSRGQYEVRGQGQLGIGGRGQAGIQSQGQVTTGTQTTFGQTQFTQQTQTQGSQFSQGQGQGVRIGQGQGVRTGEGQGVRTGEGQGVITGQGQGVITGQGQGVITGQGQGVRTGEGQGVRTGQGQGVRTGEGLGVITGQGQGVRTGQGQGVRTGEGQGVRTGQGQAVTQGQGVGVREGLGFGITQGSGLAEISGGGSLSQGLGTGVTQGFGVGVSQGFGQRVGGGQGQIVNQGSGSEVDYETSESVQRVYLKPYDAGFQCGVLNPQRPYGNRNELEVDFAEIPWQAMILLQTNRSLLCGGVITRPDVVVTSAACLDGFEAKNVLIKGGEWKLGVDDEPLPYQIVQVKHILRHPLYKPGHLQYDSAVLVLAENLRLAKNIYPICLPGPDQTLDAFYNGAGECIVTGWGKSVLQAHLSGSIMHSMNVSPINPGECQAKISEDYPHLREAYDEESCVCGVPTNPINNICKVDIGSALACTTGDSHYVLRGVYSWDSGCQPGNQLAAFFKFDMEWYEWCIGLRESVRFAQFEVTSKITQNRFSSQINSGVKGGIKGGVKGAISSQFGQLGFGQTNQYNQLDESAKYNQKIAENAQDINAGLNAPISNTFSATYTEKKVYKSEPKFVTYTTKPEIVTFTTKPEIVTFTTKPEYFTFTTKPKYVTFTTKPEYFRYTTKPKVFTFDTRSQASGAYSASASDDHPQYAVPNVSYNPSFTDLATNQHQHTAQCPCLQGK